MIGFRVGISLLMALSIGACGFDRPETVSAQDPELLQSHGLRELQGRHLRLITDLPIDDEIRTLPTIFDAAMGQWVEYFRVENVGKGEATGSEPSWSDWKATAMLIGDRSRFQQAGLLTSEIPDFRDGYQSVGRIFLMEQPSAYYRRHLLLHEGTHWIMWRMFGSAGPTWFMEGVAELLGTHTWLDGQLRMGVMPSNNAEVPYWGRLQIVKDQLANGTAPSLEEILRRPGSPRSPVDYYAWNWVTVRFLMSEPTYGPAIKELVLKHLIDKRPEQITKDLLTTLKEEWPALRAAFQCYAYDVEYGYDESRSLPSLTKPSRSLAAEAVKLQLPADHGWQSTGLLVAAGERIRVSAVGSCVLASEEEPLIGEPSGVTLDYIHGYPWGRLLACIVPLAADEPAHTEQLEILSVGRKLEWEPSRGGLLLLKINDRPNELQDNEGSYQVTVERR